MHTGFICMQMTKIATQQVAPPQVALSLIGLSENPH
jgi:hypothetical protein